MQSRAGRTLRRAARLSLSDWRLLVRAVAELLLARIRHAVLPPAAIVEGLSVEESDGDASRRRMDDTPARVAWAIGVAGAVVPWRADCLVRAMAATRWLRRCGHRPEVFVGVALPHGTFGAHAWVRCGDVAVTGGPSAGYAPILSPPALSSAGQEAMIHPVATRSRG